MRGDRILRSLRSIDRRHIMVATAIVIAAASGTAGYMLASGGESAAAGENSGGGVVDGVVQDDSGKRVLYWYDPMIPMERYPRPGKSSMNMELIPKYADEGGVGISVSPEMRQSLGIRLGEVQVQDFSPTVPAVGRIEIDERRIEEVQTYTPGWVERLAVRAVGEPVGSGSQIATVYSPELFSAQTEYAALLDMSRDVAPSSLRQAARQRLRLLGLSPGAIERLESGGSPQRTHAVYAPTSGIITAINIRPGGKVESGQSIVTIANLAQVWAVAEVPEAALGEVKVGQPVEVTFPAYPGEVRQGRVDYIYPTLDPEARTARVRVTLANPGLRLKAGMFANMTIQGTGGMALVVPSEAVINTGRRTVVITQKDGGFVPVEVQTGRATGDTTEIVSGLERGDKIVLSGQFLIDSEASLSGLVSRLSAQGADQQNQADRLAQATGVIQAFDPASRSVRIAHGPVPMMNWPAMTMTFRIGSDVSFRGSKKGDRVAFGFTREQQDGAYVIETIRKAQAR